MRLKLTQEHINNILAMDNPFKKRDYIQDVGILYYKNSGFNMICTWATSVGKTVFACKIIREIRKKHDKEIHVCVPYHNLKDQWEKSINSFELTNVKVFVIDTYMKEVRTPYLLIVDECHYKISSRDSKSAIINDFPIKYRLYLSATLKKEQLDYLAEKGLNNEFEITLKEARLLELVPPYDIYNVYVDLTFKEKEKFRLAYEKYTQYMDFFKANKIDRLPDRVPYIPGQKEETVKAIYYQCLGARSRFMSVIHNAENKLKVIEKIIPHIKNRKTIFFSKNTTTAVKIAALGNMAIYHSKQHKTIAEKNYNSFLSGENLHISSVAKMIAGVDDKNITTLVRHSFDSVSSAGIQSIGRLLRIDSEDPDKRSMAINLICRPFEGITPNDNYWIEISLKGELTKWLEVDELIEKIKQCSI